MWIIFNKRGHSRLKKKSIIDNFLYFAVHNSFLFTVLIMGLIHAILLGTMWYAGVKPLLYFNILSVIVYIFCVLLCSYGIIMPVYISIFMEVSLYAATSVYFIGWECGSPYFIFSIIPILIYFGSFLIQRFKKVDPVILLAISLSLFVLFISTTWTYGASFLGINKCKGISYAIYNIFDGDFYNFLQCNIYIFF